ncbi:MAG TPA: hypothetical protein DD473_18440 [Planctomycetaceae bacterium]|nr:hypothetical protein [Planctomycetaceae bacterium]|tara:strand:- start:651 stop:1253 length:603 start_codon:yes stop_codon:yes gene_type:complete
MTIGVIGDIHGNLLALESAILQLEKKNVTEIVCLGDIIDGGGFDSECIELIRANGIQSVRGNHDEIHDCWISAEHQEWLNQLPLKLEISGWLFSHYNPRLVEEKVNNSSVAAYAFQFAEFTKACVGHSHLCALYSHKSEWGFESSPCQFEENIYELDPCLRYLFVNPSLAYSRDGFPHPRCSIISDHSIEIVNIDASLLT